MDESFTSTSCIIFSGVQMASVRVKDMYNLMHSGIHMFFAKESILFCITGGFSDSQLFTHYRNLFPIHSHKTSLHFILLPVNRYNRCRGRSNPRYFIWYHFKIGFCCNFDVPNRNEDVDLENLYDPAKIRMVGISADNVKIIGAVVISVANES